MILEVEVEDESKPPKYTSLFQSYLNLCFILFMVPFRVDKNHKTGSYTLESFKLHSAICACLNLRMFIYHVLIVWKIHISDKLENLGIISHSFNLASNIGSVIHLVFFYRLFWFQKEDILTLIKTSEIQVDNTKHLRNFLKGLTIFGLVIYLIVYFRVLISDPELLEIFSVVQLKHYFGAFTVLENVVNSKPVELIRQAFIMHSLINYFVCQWCFFLVAVNLMIQGRTFQVELARRGRDINQGVEQYYRLKQKVLMINGIMGKKLLVFHVVFGAYYCYLPDALRGPGDLNVNSWEKIMFHFVIILATWIAAAEFHTKVSNAFRRWHEKCSLKPCELTSVWVKTVNEKIGPDITDEIRNEQKLQAIENALQREPLAMACGCFSVTYEFLSSVGSMIITYAIIVFQIQNSM